MASVKMGLHTLTSYCTLKYTANQTQSKPFAFTRQRPNYDVHQVQTLILLRAYCVQASIYWSALIHLHHVLISAN